MQGKFDQGFQRLAPGCVGWSLKQGLFVFGLKWAEHGQRVDQEFLIGLDCAVRRELANAEPSAPPETTPSFHLVDLDD